MVSRARFQRAWPIKRDSRCLTEACQSAEAVQRVYAIYRVPTRFAIVRIVARTDDTRGFPPIEHRMPEGRAAASSSALEK